MLKALILSCPCLDGRGDTRPPSVSPLLPGTQHIARTITGGSSKSRAHPSHKTQISEGAHRPTVVFIDGHGGKDSLRSADTSTGIATAKPHQVPLEDELNHLISLQVQGLWLNFMARAAGSLLLISSLPASLYWCIPWERGLFGSTAPLPSCGPLSPPFTVT